jgi:hypothetical protein
MGTRTRAESKEEVIDRLGFDPSQCYGAVDALRVSGELDVLNPNWPASDIAKRCVNALRDAGYTKKMPAAATPERTRVLDSYYQVLVACKDRDEGTRLAWSEFEAFCDGVAMTAEVEGRHKADEPAPNPDSHVHGRRMADIRPHLRRFVSVTALSLVADLLEVKDALRDLVDWWHQK